MAKVISADRLEEKRLAVENGSLALSQLREDVDLLVGFIDGQRLQDVHDMLRDAGFDGIARSVGVINRELKAADAGLNALLTKLEAEVKEAEASYEKSKENKEKVPTGASGKSGFILMPVGQPEVPADSDLTEDLKYYGGFRGTAKENRVQERFATLIAKSINRVLGREWDGSDLRIRKDKKEMIVYRTTDGGMVLRSGN